MEIACVFAPTLDTPEHMRVAEELGYHRALVYDSPAFLADAWMTLARAADRISRMRIGVCAITPRLRHLVANAGAIATLNALAPGRVDVVVGSGFTSQLMLGKGPVSWAEVEEYVVALRALLAGEDVEWEGSMIGLRHGRLSGVSVPVPVEIRVAAHGPKGYAVGDRSADGIVTNPAHHSANTGPASNARSLVLYYGTVLDPGEDYTSERVIDAAGPFAAFQLHIGEQGLASDSREAAAFRQAIEALDARLRTWRCTEAISSRSRRRSVR
jgi:5,10-methylenetetrahydromethanopterin reductase